MSDNRIEELRKIREQLGALMTLEEATTYPVLAIFDELLHDLAFASGDEGSMTFEEKRAQVFMAGMSQYHYQLTQVLDFDTNLLLTQAVATIADQFGDSEKDVQCGRVFVANEIANHCTELTGNPDPTQEGIDLGKFLKEFIANPPEPPAGVSL